MTGIIAFWLVVLVGIPLCVIAGRLYKPFLYFYYFLLVFSTAKVGWSITFVSRESYKSATRGFEVHILDILAIILLLSMLLRSEYHLRFRLPMMLMNLAFIAIGIISWLMVSDVDTVTNVPRDMRIMAKPFELKLYPLFELSKMLRGLFVYWVVANFTIDKKSVQTLLWAIVAVIFVLTAESVINRYVYHQFRVSVQGMHFNDFNVYIGMLGVFILPWAFSSESKLISVGIWTFFLLALISIILTISRSSLVGFLGGAIVVMIFGIIRYPKMKNVLAMVVCLFAGFALMAKASSFLLDRFEETRQDLPFREGLKAMAALMGRDYTWGIGLGNFAAVFFTKYAAIINFREPFIIVHNIWYLTLAEMGYIGLVAFALLWVRFYHFLLVGMFRTRVVAQVNAFEVFLGTFASSIPLQFQGLFHFSYRQTSVFFIFFIFLGTAASFYYAQKRLRSHGG